MVALTVVAIVVSLVAVVVVLAALADAFGPSAAAPTAEGETT